MEIGVDINAELSARELRNVFRENLKILVDPYPSITFVCKQIGVERSKFNRFLNGESFPQPEILQKICNFFKTDARVLLEPLAKLRKSTVDYADAGHLFAFPELKEFFLTGNISKNTAIMPSGFYRCVRHSFIQPQLYYAGITYVYEIDGMKYNKKFVTRRVAKSLGLNPNSRIDREMRGIVIGADSGVVLIDGLRKSRSFTVTFLDHVTLIKKDVLLGYCARTAPEIQGVTSISKLVCEKLPNDFGQIRNACRKAGLIEEKDLPEFYHRFL